METREDLRIQEIETALACIKTCPRCSAAEGFWLGLESESIFAYCKSCGSKYELVEIYDVTEKRSSKQLRFLKK